MPDLACPTEFADPFKCPTKEQYLIQLLALLPRGRAWQSHEAATSAVIDRYTDNVAECGEAQCGDAMLGQQAITVERTVLSAYWAAFAELCEYVSGRACELLDEFRCHSIDETFDWWSIDYDFPDPCDPWDDLCEKVAALGGATCDYITWAAARRGWDILCYDCGDATPQAQAGCTFVGPWASTCFDCQPNTLKIVINALSSPAYTIHRDPAMVGCTYVGCITLCPTPNIQQIECLVERIKPAHVEAVYIYETAHRLETRGLQLSSPVLGMPGVYLDQLTALDLTVGSPVIGTPTFTSLAALPLAVGSPTLGTPTLTEI